MKYLVVLLFANFLAVLSWSPLQSVNRLRALKKLPNALLKTNSLSKEQNLFSYNTFGRYQTLPRNHEIQLQSTSISIDKEITNSALPKHSNLVEGNLSNGLRYVILPNSVPAGRFEAHLEVLSGSAHELKNQQGMAHLLEHVAYMGSPKRQLISGTGSRTNAYTDFHHTVFYAACPTFTPGQFWKKAMLPMALDALLDVMTTKVEDDRLEKERAAVLSEASMINKMEYRVECQILSALHSENRISSRFPIGKEHMIKTWTREDVQFYHSLHYRPDNVILYVVGDVEIPNTIETIKEKFGGLKPLIDHEKVFAESGEFPDVSLRSMNAHFPPVVHRWSSSKEATELLVTSDLVDAAPDVVDQQYTDLLPNPRIFKHELMQSFSFHLFAKRPMEPVTSWQTLRRELMRRIALSALQIRFNVQQRQDPLFTFVDFNQLNWPREGCAVCSLDLTTEPANWQEAVKVAVREIRTLGQFGLSPSEVERYKQALLSEAEQSAAQADQLNNEAILAELMEADACGHTFMHPYQRLDATAKALNSITADEVNEVARELCEHICEIRPEDGVKPAAIIACAPTIDRNNQEFNLSENEVLDSILQALQQPIEPPVETLVPDTLITPEELEAKASLFPPAWIPLEAKAARDGKNNLGVVQKMLSNGVKVNLASKDDESQRAAFRLYVPGGRMLEDKQKPGAVLIGSRTIQEGGAFLSMTREEVELFCIDNLVMVEILATDEALIFDFQTMTTPGPAGKITGLEAAMQVAHIIFTDFKYEDDAFERAKQSLHEQFDSIVKSLETACQERLLQSVTGSDPRFCFPNHQIIDDMDLETAKNAVVSQLAPESLEVSISADCSIAELENLTLKYFGTIPPKKKQRLVIPPESINISPASKGKVLGVYLPDLEERAMGYLVGPTPNMWGIFSDGASVGEAMAKAAGKKDDNRRANPLFAHLTLLVLQEVVNRRLFSVVREERRLTYDASFQLRGQEAIKGGWYLVSVTSSPEQVDQAVRACKEALASLRGPFGVLGDAVQSAKRSISNRFRADQGTNKFWVDNMCGTQLEHIPHKSLKCISEFENVLSSINVQDLQNLVEVLAFDDANMIAGIGIASPNSPNSAK